MKYTGIFYDSDTKIEEQCNLVIQNNSLLIYLQDVGKTLLIWNIKSFKTCELNGLDLKVVNGQHINQSILCSGEVAKLIFKKWKDDEVPDELSNKNKSKPILILIVLCLVVLLIGLLSYFYLLPFIGEKAVKLIPLETEIELGNSIADKISGTSELNDSVNYYAKQFVSNLKFESHYPIKVTVINSKELNAFALPGGNIFVYSQIIKKMDNYQQFVALIAHEQTHVNQQHSLKSICRSAAAGILIATLFGDISGISAGILYQAQQFEQLNYSRDLETEADDMGIKFMQQNKTNPQGMVQLLELLNKENVEMPSMMKYLSTHPETESRILNVKSQITNTKAFTKNGDLESLFFKLKSKL